MVGGTGIGQGAFFHRVEPPVQHIRQGIIVQGQGAGMRKFVPVGQVMVVDKPVWHNIVFMPQHPIQGMHGSYEFLADIGSDKRVYQRVHRRVLDPDQVATAFLIRRLRGPEISLLIARRL